MMKTFLALALIALSSTLFAACEEFSKSFDQLIQSEIETNKNLAHYMEQNANGWEEADSLLRSGRLNSRTYNGGMGTNAQNSRKNSNAIRTRNNQISSHGKDLKAELTRCLAEAAAKPETTPPVVEIN
jgi:hypothetical protein